MAGKLIIISAPSGSGKTTIIKHLLSLDFKLEFSVSATSRPIRKGEEHGKAYYFLSAEEFKSKVKNNEFLEFEEVYKDTFYGTLKSEVERIRNKGNNVIFDVDIVGGLNIKKFYGKDALAIFIKPPSVEELRKRLDARQDGTINVDERVEKARLEMLSIDEFDCIVVNDELDRAKSDAAAKVSDFLSK
ncbi:MAG: guanylate kinase [Bacteroidetes bacterium GWF2_38_335]|nr:MAG: guanylate kinase [Bacteroidetes bacterium GWF2_38_335]HBS88005.1 guanylate kinase [Bacteroidales bacterium]